MSSFNQQNRDGAKLHQAQKAAEKSKGPATSWWLDKDRQSFQAEVKRQACVPLELAESVRSLVGEGHLVCARVSSFTLFCVIGAVNAEQDPNRT